MRYELLIAMRFISSGKRQTLLSVGAIAIAVMVMIVVIGMVVGMDEQIHDTTVDRLSHVTVSPEDRNDHIYLYDHIVTEIESMDHVIAASPGLEGGIALSKADRYRNAQLRGIDVEREDLVFSIRKDIRDGSFDDLIFQQNTIVIGSDLAQRLDVETGGLVHASFPQARSMSLRIVGIFETGTPADGNVVYTSIRTAQYFYDKPNVVTTIYVRLDDHYKDREVAGKIKGEGLQAAGWTELNPDILQLINLAYVANVIETGLVAIIASFGVISALNTMVMSKVREIGILMAMGVPKSSIRKIFVIQSGILGILGSLTGALTGILIARSIGVFEYHETDAVLGISEIPVIVRAMDVFLIMVAITLLNLLAGIYPAYKAASLDPVKAISS